MKDTVISCLVKACFFIIRFSEPGETRPSNGCSLDGAEIIYYVIFLLHELTNIIWKLFNGEWLSGHWWDNDDWCFTATFVDKVDWMGRTTYKGNEGKSKMKHPSDMLTPRFELRCMKLMRTHAKLKNTIFLKTTIWN